MEVSTPLAVSASCLAPGNAVLCCDVDDQLPMNSLRSPGNKVCVSCVVATFLFAVQQVADAMMPVAMTVIVAVPAVAVADVPC